MHAPKTGASALLIGSDNSSTCLSCHMNANDTGPSSYHVSTVDAKLGTGMSPLQRGPAGDFGWLKKSYSWGTGADQNELGERHGHNIIAADFGFAVDSKWTTSPGGASNAYPSSQLACSSCHDPHGKGRRLSDGSYAFTGAPIIGSGSYDNSPTPAAGEAVGLYRLLRTPLYTGWTAYPIAVAPSSYNRTEAATQTRVAYGHSTDGVNTWGKWCATCHADMHSSGRDGLTHPVDVQLGDTIAGLYNSYKKSGDLTGTQGTAYLSLVPFAENTSDITILKTHAKNDDSVLTGPSTSDRVMCLSCHRAHASGFNNMLRFDQGYEFMVKGGQYIGYDNPLVGTSGRGPTQSRNKTIAEWQAAYYDRPASIFATYQRVLCNKCHAKD